MLKTIEYSPKRLFNGLASVRDYIVKDAIEKLKDMVIVYKGERMTIPYSQLQKAMFQIHKISFRSKYEDKSYQLIDFKFIPDGGRDASKMVRTEEPPKEVPKAGKEVSKETQLKFIP